MGLGWFPIKPSNALSIRRRWRWSMAGSADGQTVAPQAVRIAFVKIRASGLAAVALPMPGHIGRSATGAEGGSRSTVSVPLRHAAVLVRWRPMAVSIAANVDVHPNCVGIPRQVQGPIVLIVRLRSSPRQGACRKPRRQELPRRRR